MHPSHPEDRDDPPAGNRSRISRWGKTGRPLVQYVSNRETRLGHGRLRSPRGNDHTIGRYRRHWQTPLQGNPVGTGRGTKQERMPGIGATSPSARSCTKDRSDHIAITGDRISQDSSSPFPKRPLRLAIHVRRFVRVAENGPLRTPPPRFTFTSPIRSYGTERSKRIKERRKPKERVRPNHAGSPCGSGIHVLASGCR